jgi:F-type H+-transporting ATPase subunit delta
MIAQEVAKKYAKALFLSTQSRGLIEQAHDQFTGLREALGDDRTLLNFLSSPRVDEEQKVGLLRKVFAGRMEELFVEFLAVLVRKRRANYLPEVIDEFNRLVDFEKGIARVTVITAVPLIANEEKNLIARLRARTSGTIVLEKKVDPSIMGGMIIILHDQIIDGSVRHGINLIEDQLQKIKVHSAASDGSMKCGQPRQDVRRRTTPADGRPGPAGLERWM